MINHLIISGDSFVEGVGDNPDIGGWAKRVANYFSNIKTDIYGFGGQTVKEIEKRYTEEIANANKAVVIFQIGLNDSRIRDSLKERNEVEINAFANSYNLIVRNCKKNKEISRVILLGLTLVDEFKTIPYKPDKYYSNYQILKFDKAVAEVANNQGVKFIELHTLINDTNGTLVDGVHPNPTGHKIIAENVIREIECDVQFNK